MVELIKINRKGKVKIMDKNYIEKIALMLTNILDKMAREGRIYTYECIFNEDDDSFHFSIEFKDIAYCGIIDKDGLEYYTIEDEPKDFMPRYDENYNDLLKDKN